MAPAVLVLAGSEPLAYAGLQADLRHLERLGLRAVGCPTALTEQSVERVHRVLACPVEHVLVALELGLAEGGVAAIKVGLIADPALATALGSALRKSSVPVILDPVLAASSGDDFASDELVDAYVNDLIPAAFLVTPNLPELSRLVRNKLSVAERTNALLQTGAKAVLVKGGHGPSTARQVEDLLFTKTGVQKFSGPRHAGASVRGTGCALSTAIAAFLARGLGLEDAVFAARLRVSEAIAHAAMSNSRRLEL